MTRAIRIMEPTDPRVAAYCRIRERDLVGRDKLFIAEGRVVLTSLLASPLYEIRSLFVADHKIAQLEPLFVKIPEDVPVYTAERDVMNGVAGFDIHRGILAIGARRGWPDPDRLLGTLQGRRTVLLLNAIANHDNMGGLFRNAAAFGVDAVLLDAQCCDPLYRKAIRVSVGAVLRIPFARVTSDPIELLERHGFEPVALSPSGDVPLHRLNPPERVALLLGAEGPGLSADLLAQTMRVRIEMTADFDSLNVATACGIALHHLACGGSGGQAVRSRLR